MLLTISRKPVPHKRPDKHVEEISVSRDRPAVTLRGICLAMIMKSIYKCGIHQCPRPDHRCRFHEIFAHHASYSKSDALGCNSEKDIEAPAEILAVEASLGNDSISEVGHTIPKGSISHDHNQPMLFHIERARFQVPPEAECIEAP
jgi:hypothetical protein